MLSLDSPGFWNVRTENLDTWYLGQETYIRVVDPDGGYNVTEMVAPDNMLYCGLLKDKQKYAICLCAALDSRSFLHIAIYEQCLMLQLSLFSRAQKPHGSSSSSVYAAKLNGYLLAVLVSLVALTFFH